MKTTNTFSVQLLSAVNKGKKDKAIIYARVNVNSNVQKYLLKELFILPNGTLAPKA